ncbi:MAG: DUF222 domain-containing protein [Actinomycetes bacterium]
MQVVSQARTKLTELLTAAQPSDETRGERGLGSAPRGPRAALSAVPDGCLAGLYRELAGLTAACATATAAVVAEAGARDVPAQVGERSVSGWLQRAGRLTRGQASHEHATASTVLAVPPVTTGLARGEFGVRAAAMLSRSLQTIGELPGVTESVYREAESTALRLAGQLDISQLGQALQALVEALTTTPDVDDDEAAASAAEAAAKAWRERYLVVNTDTGRITGRLPVPMAQALQSALDALAAHRSRDLPPEALAAAAAAGARVWIDHVEGCPADTGDAVMAAPAPDGTTPPAGPNSTATTHAPTAHAARDAAAAAQSARDAVAAAHAARDAVAAAHAAARSKNRRVRDSAFGPIADELPLAPAEGKQTRAATDATTPFTTSCGCPWRIEWPLECTCGGGETDLAGWHVEEGADRPTDSPDQHASGCPLAATGMHGHDESGEPLLRRTRAQSQADAIFELARLGLDARLLPTQDAAPPHLTLHATPADLDRDLPTASYPDGTAADPSAVAAVLCDAVITTVLFDPSGLLLGVAGDQRTWPRRLRRAIAARDRRCAFPGCETVPALCHVHHMVHVEHGGPTCADNGCLLCPLHHALVHDLGYDVRLNPRNGRPEFQPPAWVDPHRRWRQHPRYQLEHLRRTGQLPRPLERDPRRCPKPTARRPGLWSGDGPDWAQPPHDPDGG